VRDIRAFRRNAQEFAAAADALVAEGLVLRIGGDDPAAAGFRLNPERFSDLRHELRPPLWRIALLAAASIIAGALAYMTLRQG
jgi:hypothetical protein